MDWQSSLFLSVVAVLTVANIVAGVIFHLLARLHEERDESSRLRAELAATRRDLDAVQEREILFHGKPTTYFREAA